MHHTKLIHAARTKRQAEVIFYLNQRFKDFPYPVYLFSSFTKGDFHGYSDIDLLILTSKEQANQAYAKACDRLSDWDTPYDILTCQSMDELDNTIQSSLVPLQGLQPSFSRQRRQHGMTLIEIMIALLIGAFMLGGILQIFINTKQTYRMQENLSRLQENGRYALSFLEHDIRMAGFWGCLTPNSPNTDVAGTNDDTSDANVDNGTDTITVKGAFVQATTGNCGTTVDTGQTYYTDPTSSIGFRIQSAVLERTDNGGSFQELIEGIQDMQIIYGEDTDADGTPNYYVSADQVVNMEQVVTVRISLLAVTLDDNLSLNPVAYTFPPNNPTPTTPSDRKIRRVFNTTIALRNRL